MDPIERLQRIRSLFFDKPFSLGQQPLRYARQSDGNTLQAEEKQMVENAIWTYGDVLFASLHVVGSNNNLGRDSANDAEFQARDKANLVWLKTAFNEARIMSAKAVVLIFHANPRFGKQKARTGQKSGFRAFLTLLPELVKEFQRPVLMVHGDTHQLVIDRPFLDRDDNLVRNAIRLEIMGAPDVGAVEVRVDTGTDAVFSFTPFYAPVLAPEVSDR